MSKKEKGRTMIDNLFIYFQLTVFKFRKQYKKITFLLLFFFLFFLNCSSNHMDLIFQDRAPHTKLLSIEVNPADISMAKGLTQQYSATGIFSDGSTDDITDEVTWSSSAQANASLTDDGEAVGLVANTTVTITATLEVK